MYRKSLRSGMHHWSCVPIGCTSPKARSAMSHETPLERFRKACGLGAPLALAAQGTDAPAPSSQPLEWPGPFLFIGSHPTADLSLYSRQVSRRHVYLQAVAGRLIGIDLKTRTGTFWEDR